MGFSAFWEGLVISLQYFATLLSRPHAGRYADLLGPKKIVVFGLCGCFLSGLGYLTAGLTASLPVISLLLLCLGRVILGIGQSFAGTGSTRGALAWLARCRASDFVERHCHLRGDGDGGAVRRRVLSLGGLAGVSVNHYGRGAGGHFVGDPASTVKASKGRRCCFARCLGASGCTHGTGTASAGLASSPPLSRCFMTLKVGTVRLSRYAVAAVRLSVRVCYSLTALTDWRLKRSDDLL